VPASIVKPMMDTGFTVITLEISSDATNTPVMRSLARVPRPGPLGWLRSASRSLTSIRHREGRTR